MNINNKQVQLIQQNLLKKLIDAKIAKIEESQLQKQWPVTMV